MIRGITISNIRGIREGSLSQFTAIVVLVGPNSSGKSTVLDALFLGASPRAQNGLGRVVSRRKGSGQAEWLLYRSFGRGAAEGKVEITSDGPAPRITTIANPGQQPEYSVDRLTDVPEIRLVEPSEDPGLLVGLYSDASIRGVRREAKEIVKSILPNVDDIEILTMKPGNTPFLHIVYKDGAQPVTSAGDGVRLLLQQSLELAAPAGGVVLLEEPEVHLHPAAMHQSALAIVAAMRRRIQVILTTHSLDFIDALLSAINEDEIDNISLFRLQLQEGVLSSYKLTGREATFSRNQIQDDLR